MMTLAEYLRRKEERALHAAKRRARCGRCLRPQRVCYCAKIRAFAPDTRFVILMHRNEARRGIASGRMAHLCLANSELWQGTDFTDDERVNAVLADPTAFPVLLYPGRGATDLSAMPVGERRRLAPAGKRLTVFILDGTWSTARKMRRLSRNLHAIPMICFTPRAPSRFSIVRRQPMPKCYSTLEAIHELCDLLAPDAPERPHDNLLEVFETMVQNQLHYQTEVRAYRREVRSTPRPPGPKRGVRRVRPVVTA